MRAFSRAEVAGKLDHVSTSSKVGKAAKVSCQRCPKGELWPRETASLMPLSDIRQCRLSDTASDGHPLFSKGAYVGTIYDGWGLREGRASTGQAH